MLHIPSDPAAVLVVEDEPLVRIFVSDILGQSGFTVVSAATGDEALCRIAEGGICAVVSDVAMPGQVNGFELARRVHEEFPRTGVVLVSGVLEPSQENLPCGVRFVTKPVKASTLLRLVREVADPRVQLPEPGMELRLKPNFTRRMRLNMLVARPDRSTRARADLRRITGLAPMARTTPRSQALMVPAKRAQSRATAPLPAFAPPQLATLVSEPPEGGDWLHEIKYDGYRAIAAVSGGRCRIYTRSGQDWTSKFASIAEALRALEVGSALLDGEIVALDEHGRSRFQLLQSSLKDGSSPLTYYVFDILEFDGRDVRDEPLKRRKEILRKALQGAPDSIRYSGDMAGQGKRVLAEASRLGLEGIVSKEAGKPYISRRTQSWLKCKCTGQEEFVIGGYRKSDKKGRPFASLLVGEFVGGKLHYRGRVGTGFDAATLDELSARFAKLARKTSPFVDVPRAIGRDVGWVEPRLVAQIAFTERTKDGILRHPAYLGLREDKPAKEVQAQAVMTMAKIADPDDIAGVRLTHPERVLFSGAGLTKLDLARYFLAVSSRMLPYAGNRPISLVRCPDGESGERFFQKHHKKGMPAALKPVRIEENDGEAADYLKVDDAAGLVAVAQIAGLEIHPWGARIGNLEHPERLIFDLDPDTALGFADVRDAARDVRRLLQTAGLESFALVTGGKGIHVIAPLEGKQDWDTVKSFARGVAEKLAETEPERFVATMSKAKRRGRIFIDWLRNERGATAVAPYSPRAKPEASVATPVAWAELSRIEAANVFTIPSVLQRIKRKTDPWSDYQKTRQKISREALRFFT